MSYFVRRARKTNWSSAPPHTPQQREAAAGDFQLREGEEGLSMYAIATTDNETAVVAGVATQKYVLDGELRAVDLLELQEDEVAEAGDVVICEGETPLP